MFWSWTHVLPSSVEDGFCMSAGFTRHELASDHGKSGTARNRWPLSTITHSRPSSASAGIIHSANAHSGGQNPFEYSVVSHSCLYCSL